MRWMWTMVGATLLALLLVGGVGADGAGREPAKAKASAQAERAEVLVHALDVLRVRMEARVQAAEVLQELGRMDEALEALRSVDAVYENGLNRIEALLAGPRLGSTPGGVGRVSGVPPAGPSSKVGPGVGGAGGAFRGRGGSRVARRVDAVHAGLKWLAAHQSPDGGWEAAGFGNWCNGKPSAQPKDGPAFDGAGKPLYDVGVTGISLLAFLGAGYTNRGDHEYAKVVAKGFRYLKNKQDAEGCFGPRVSQHFIYSHATAALAMIEIYGMTGSPIFKQSAQKALDFIADSRNPYFAWRYGVKPGENDTSVTGWMVAALKSARLVNEAAKKQGKPAPLIVDEEAFEGARQWVEKMTDPDYGRVGYIQRGGSPARPQNLIDAFPGEKSESMTAVGLLIRMWSGEDPAKSGIIRKGAALLEARPPVWNPTDGSIDMYYWVMGTLAAFQVGGETWSTWSKAIRKLPAAQRKDTAPCLLQGSWDPAGPWGQDGGRVYSTAMMTLVLEVQSRSERVFGTN